MKMNTTVDHGTSRSAGIRDRATRWFSAHRAELVTVIALATVATTWLWWFRREPVYSDDLGYWTRWASLETRSGMANPHRLIMAFSAEFARWIFGYSMTAYNAVGIGYGVGVLILTYLLVRYMFPRIVGFAAVALLMTSTVFMQDVTLLVPDWAAMFWFLAGLVLVLHAIPPDERKIVSSRTATRSVVPPTVLALLAGVAFHSMWFAKEAALPILVAIPLVLAVAGPAKRAVRLTATAAVSTATSFALELALMWHLYGDPFRRLAMIMRGHVSSRLSDRLGGGVESTPELDAAPDMATGSAVEAAEAAAAARTDFADWWQLAERYTDPISSTWNGRLLLWLLAVALVVTVVARSRRLWIIAIPAIVGIAATVFAVGSINPLVPLLSMKFRYLALGWVFVPALIAAALWVAVKGIAQLYTERNGAVAASRLVVLALIALPTTATGVWAAAEHPSFVRNGANGLQAAADAIDRLAEQGLPLGRIITDGRTIQGLHIQLRGDPDSFLTGSHSDFTNAEAGDIVIVNRKREGLPTMPARSNRPMPEWLLFPPSEWRYLGDAEFADIFIYYIEEDWTPPPTMSTSGRDLSQVTRGTQLDGDGAEFGWQREGAGVFLWMQDVRNARFVTGHGSHPRAAHSEGSEQLVITERGRLGARVELHLTADIRIGGVWLRTYDADGNMRQNARMYQTTEAERVSVPQFAVNIADMRSVSFAGSLEVDPHVDKSFRVVGFASGSGILTIDRIAVSTMSDVAATG